MFKKRKKIQLISLALFLNSFPLFTFELDPWFTPLAEFNLRPSYSYRYYPDIDRSLASSPYSSYDHQIDLNLGVSFLPNWDFQVETNFAKTRELSWGTQRVGVQIRYLLMDDVVGDLMSLCVGGQLFYVPTRYLSDPSSPYHGQGNIELNASFGKEIAKFYDWKYRFYAFVGIGQANRGYPWLRSLICGEFKYKKNHQFQLLSRGYFGFGNKDKVDIEKLNGYGKIGHRSIDVGGSYHYLFKIWGSLGVEYTYRLYARAFPKKEHLLMINYELPFSLF